MNSKTELAANFYMQVPKEYNCAQTVAKAFGRDDLLETLKSCGGGRAPNGLCGALHSALLLVPEGEQETVKQRFFEEVGEIHCKPIRKAGQTKCVDCVRTAAGLLEQYKL